ncbi:peptidase M14, carboxypeptidase A [Trichodesmium erythraeum IMS101]|uniref:Peptidase M14, carboxypeptidase A n=1 Tax=Trichodesmium erythraeum (strain IMS101) TaxID=203124 RepID=Q110I7_TRIEI|nr:carboxypeptidase [Trichodesmium erythraeum GBRTRLIN201]
MTKSGFDFSHYYKYQEIVNFLHQMREKNPHLIELKVIGKSYGGLDIFLATLTNQNTGKAREKPGYWIDGNIHAVEVTGSAVALYIIYHLLNNYNSNPQVTYLLDNHTIYILPRIAVDGAEKYLTTPYIVRSSIRHYPYPEEKDGLHWEDINGDGLILQMRLKDNCGAWKISSEDPRIMVPREPDEFGGTYYSILPEGMIKNYDGYNIKVAPSKGGIDFNRNYPHEWQPEGKQKGAGDFPFSEPETLAVAEFWREHPNINGFINYHTFSGVILRSYCTYPDEHFPVKDLEIYKLIGEKGTAITGYECISIYHNFLYPNSEKIYGGMVDYCYDRFGWFGFSIELWDAPTEAGVKKNDYIKWLQRHPVTDDLKMMQWNDEKLGGTGFIDWETFEHPQLGTVEIGGWNWKIWYNPPVEYLPKLCKEQCQFAISHALMSPRLAVSQVVVEHQGGDMYHLVVQLENQGFLPTYTSEKALEQKSVKPIEVILNLPGNVTLVSGKQKQEIEHLEGRASEAFNFFSFFTKLGGYRCHLEWVVKGVANSEIKVTAKAERAGVVKTVITLPE